MINEGEKCIKLQLLHRRRLPKWRGCAKKRVKKKKKALSEILPFLWKNIINSSCSPLWNTGHHTGHHTFR